MADPLRRFVERIASLDEHPVSLKDPELVALIREARRLLKRSTPGKR